MSKSSTRRFTAILISGALASKVLGFGREILMANVLGASLVADGFRGAITAVMLPLAFLQNESVPAIMIPMHRDALKAGNGPQRLGALTVAVTAVATLLMIGIQILGEYWIHAFVGGFSAEGRSLTLDFVRIMALGMPASAMINVLAAGEIALGRTRLTNVRASILNIAVLIGIALLSASGNFHTLAWSFSIAFNVLGAWGLYTMWREGVLSFRGLTLADVASAGREYLRRLRPLLALPVAEQANVWVERLLASRVATGAVASMDYARTLTESALLLISQPVGLAVLSSHPPKDPAAQVESIARPILALALPASAFLVMFAPEIVRLVFFRGAFNDHAVTLTSQALRGIAFGLWASTLGWILIRILNGAGRNFAAAVIIVTAYVVNTAVNFLTLQVLGAGDGTLMLGVGETARGFVLLAGVVIALDSRRKLLWLILLASFPAALMALLGWQIHERIDGTLPRLMAGGLAYLACIALGVAMLIPSLCVAAFARVRLLLRI
ncbi:lipid II flippase MurJ [Tardiphaga sp.]|uniref:lipid II flippase MurJ n=1 Tax=Tardiphaga sp. TaxID=1926292 RepID=UPI002A61F6AD|nr:putative Virulence factor MviN-like protein [Tardiphaga sp.]